MVQVVLGNVVFVFDRLPGYYYLYSVISRRFDRFIILHHVDLDRSILDDLSRVFRGISGDRLVFVESGDVSRDVLGYLFSEDIDLIDLSYASSETTALVLLQDLLGASNPVKKLKIGDLLLDPGLPRLLRSSGKSQCMRIYQHLCMGEEHRRAIMDSLTISISSLYRCLRRLSGMGLVVNTREKIRLTYTGEKLCRLLF